MYAAKYVFSKSFFVAWVVVSIIWVWGTMIVVGFFPIIDGWKQINLVIRGAPRNQENSPVSASVDEDEGKVDSDAAEKSG